jgi:hypothetical protein
VTIARARPGLREDLAWRLTRARSMGDRDTPEDDEAFRDLWALGPCLRSVSLCRGP